MRQSTRVDKNNVNGMSNVKGTGQAHTDTVCNVMRCSRRRSKHNDCHIERDGDIAEIKTGVMKQFSSEHVNSLERLDNLMMVEKTELIEYH